MSQTANCSSTVAARRFVCLRPFASRARRPTPGRTPRPVVILSRRPAALGGLHAALASTKVPPDFLDATERSQAEQSRGPLDALHP